MAVLAVLGLAVLQGLTEFLPVSSSGHLALAQRLLGFGEPPLLFNVSLHVGTLAAIVFLFRRDVVRVVGAGFRWLARSVRTLGRGGAAAPADEREREALGVVLATAVTGAVAMLFRERLEAAASSASMLGALFIVGAVPLALTRWAPAGTRGIDAGRALLIGLAQGVAILPGVSRSGLTIAAALFLGVDRGSAARFSFLAAIPAIAGAEAIGLAHGMSGVAVPPWQHVFGAAVAALVGFASLWLLVRLVRCGGLHWFAAYLVPLGVAVLIFVA